MVQVGLKEIHETKNWKEFEEEWRKTSNFAALTGFLHTGLGIAIKPEELGDAIRFYLRVARWIDFRLGFPFHYGLGKKAYQVLISRIGTAIYWLEPLSSIKLKPVLEDLIGFFAEMSLPEKKARRKVVYESKEQPYRKDMEFLLINLWEGTRTIRVGLKFAKEILLENKEKIVKALVNARLFRLILRDNIFEAIPVLKEDIYWQIIWHTPISTLKEFTKRFAGIAAFRERTFVIEDSWMIEELDNLGSKGFEFALSLAGNMLVDKEEIFTLEELIVKRDIPPSLKVKLF